MPARLSTFQTVEWHKPVAPATRRGPQPVSRRQAQIASASSGASCRGERRGRLERSSKQDRLRLASSFASIQRCHQRCAVAGETLKQTAAAFNERPSSIAPTSARRPASPSFALACRDIRSSFEQVFGETHSLKGGPDEIPLAVHNLCRHVI